MKRFQHERIYAEGRELFFHGQYDEAIDRFKRIYEETLAHRDTVEIVDDYYTLPQPQWVAKWQARLQTQNT
ncbi:MAG: hypothetical protein ABSE16_03080 [Verrucomicrobiota bacterium]|jgi:hypothetical protein